MAIRATVQMGDPCLRENCPPVTDFTSSRWDRLVGDLADALHHWQERSTYGRGIAAPQIGEQVRLIYIESFTPAVFVNPSIVAASAGTWQPWDACLSFSLAFFCRVTRHQWVDADYCDLSGQRHRISLTPFDLGLGFDFTRWLPAGYTQGAGRADRRALRGEPGLTS
jgi:peptide deformylase